MAGTTEASTEEPAASQPDAAEWLIVLTMPNAGSTALAGVLMSAPGSVSLNPMAEGQWLIPELAAPAHLWRPDRRIDYARARDIWMKTVLERAALPARSPVVPLVIEKSPSSLVRHRDIIRMLAPMEVHAMVLLRDPFATCASWKRRYPLGRMRHVWGLQVAEDADGPAIFRALAQLWVERARCLELARLEGAHVMRYEDFCADPGAAKAALSTFMPRMAHANPYVKVVVKDHGLQPVTNMNARTVRAVPAPALEAMTAVFSEHAGLLAKFGYAPVPPGSETMDADPD
jgi:hypothetical protein